MAKMDGDAPDTSGQAFLPIADEGPPGSAPSCSQPPNNPVFFARKTLKRREEKSPHSPPPAGGGNLNTADPEARKPRRFRSPVRAGEEITRLRAEIATIREAMRDLYYPGGCAHKVQPTGEKAVKADRLRARWDEIERQIEALEVSAEERPEKTGGSGR